MARVFVAGATGATGRLLTAELLERGHEVRAVVRSAGGMPADTRKSSALTLTEASLLDLDDASLAAQVAGCDAVVSCLGHNISFRGLFGPPRDLCTRAARRLCAAIAAGDPGQPVRFILMSSVGVANTRTDPRRKAHERTALFLLRHLLPPHRDNETASAFLVSEISDRHASIEWLALRPDTLIDGAGGDYALAEAPASGLFAGRPTARANVARCMADLVESNALWQRWHHATPVITDADAAG